MRGIVIAGPESREVFKDIFDGSTIDARWVAGPDTAAGHVCDFVLDLDFRADPRRIAELDAIPAPLILINGVTSTLHALGADPRYARINAWNTFLQRPLAEIVAPHAGIDRVAACCMAWGKITEFLPDVPGMPSARIISMIVNEAYLAWGEGVSSKEDIDTAMRLGTNYPFGPFAWGQQIGLGHICELLEALALEDPLYSIAPPLREEALADGPVA